MAGSRGGRGAWLRLGLVGWLTPVLVLAAVSGARAQNLGAQRFVPASSEDGVLGTEGAERRVPLRPYVALWMNYGINPLILLDQNEDEVGPLISDLFMVDLTFSINVWKGLELGFNVPFALVREGDDDVLAGSGLGLASGAAVGDLELRLGYRFDMGPEDGLALHVPLLLPTVAEDDPIGLGFGIKPTLAYTHGFDRVDLHFNLLVLLREEAQALDYDGGSELGFRTGVRFGLDDAWDTSLLAELGLTTPFSDFFSAGGTPVELRAGVDHWFDRTWRLTGFLGVGLTGGVGAPDVRLGLGIAYGHQPNRPRGEEGDRDNDGYADDEEAADEARRANADGRDNDGDGQVDEEDEVDSGNEGEDGRDNDGDGEIDEQDEQRGGRGRVDECPDEPEDFDGFEDDDGCPDPDNDNDGLDDDEDACPNQPETPDGIADDDGCPDRVRVQGTLITTFEPIRFETDSDRLLPESYPILHEVGTVMHANPGMDIRVEGHTDSVGDDEHNLVLSQQRAESVRRYLTEVEHVHSDRLEAVGIGEARPMASNATDEGRAQNRRVEFHILE